MSAGRRPMQRVAHAHGARGAREASAGRRALVRALPAAAALLAAGGCVSIGGGDLPASVWYLLEDRGQTAAAEGAPIARALLVGPVQASAFDESSMLAYGREPGTRAHYRFAGWTERPARRIGVLVERRLAARGRFAAVAQTTAGIRGDLLLNLSLEHLYHDVSASPGVARVALVAELVRWDERALLARRGFERTEPVHREAADAAVDAVNRAFSSLLDELCPWVEAAARGG